MMWSQTLTSDGKRPAAVAGQFYPRDPRELRMDIRRYLREAGTFEGSGPKAVIAPHAGYMYSGPIAGSVYARVAASREPIRRVVLLGPSHYAAFRGLGASSASAFLTPLGEVEVDREGNALARRLPGVATRDDAHREEHSLEVQLPFLQETLPQFTIVPLLVGDATAEEVALVLEALWGGKETLVVVSSDLSHYHAYDRARALDQEAAAAIEALEAHRLGQEQACGCRPIRGLLVAARRRGLKCATVDLRNSGDTAGRRDRVVGYGGFIFLEEL